MPLTRESVLDEKNYCSSKVSEQCRYVGFGLTIACFSLLTSTSVFAQDFVQQFKFHLICSTILGCLSVLFDTIQYIAGYWNVLSTFKKGEKSNEFDYDDDSWCYQLRDAMYRIKQITVLVGSIWFVVIIFMSILSFSSKPSTSTKGVSLPSTLFSVSDVKGLAS